MLDAISRKNGLSYHLVTSLYCAMQLNEIQSALKRQQLRTSVIANTDILMINYSVFSLHVKS